MSLFILRDTKKNQNKKGEKRKKKEKKKGEKKSFTENMGFSFVLFTAFLIPPPPWRQCLFFSGKNPQKALAKFGYNELNMKVELLNHLSVFLATYLNHVQKYGFFLFENLVELWLLKILKKKNLILTLLIFNIAFWLASFLKIWLSSGY